MVRIKMVKTEGAEESVELLAASVVQVAESFKRIGDGPLTERGLIILLQDGIGSTNITRTQIKLVLDALPQLKGWYIKEA